MESGHHHEIVKLVSDIGFSTAFIGAFFSFFSVWQFCIAQISPFFIAFLVGAYLGEGGTLKKTVIKLCIPSLGYLAGFSIIFALLGASSTNIAGYLLYHIRGFRLASGILVLLTGLFMISIGLVRSIVTISPNRILWMLAPFLGASFAFIYSPCIPPVLSQVLGYASVPENTVRGVMLLVVYGVGLSASFISVGAPLALVMGWLTQRGVRPGYIISVCAFLLMVMGIMAIASLMVYYKAFLLSFFIE